MFCTSTIGRQRFSLAAGVGVLRRGSVHIDDVLVGWMAIAGYVVYQLFQLVTSMMLCVYTQGPGGQQKKKTRIILFFFFFFLMEFKNIDDGPLLRIPFFKVDCHVSVAAVKMGQVADPS